MSGIAKKPLLSPSQIADYRREGYLIHPDAIFPEAKFNALKAHFDEKLAALPPDVRPEEMDVPHFTDPKLFEWLFADELLDLVEPIVGPDIVLFSSHFICKPRGNGKRVPWHEDTFYWKGMMTPIDVCTVWLAIDPSNRANGCMKVIPRALHGYSDYEPVDPTKNVFSTEVKQAMRDDSKSVYIELDQNHASLHEGHLMHGSEPNTSDTRRCGYTIRFMPATVKINEERIGAWHQVYLARGRDRAGNRYADPSKSHDQLMRERANGGKRVH